MVKTKVSLQVVTRVISVCLGLAIAPSVLIPIGARSQPPVQTTKESVQVSFRSPRTSGEPKQSGTTGTRGECLQNQGKIPLLTPLTPDTKQGLTPTTGTVTEYPTLTVSKHPAFLVYVPPTSVREAEFVLTDASNTREIYYQKFALPSTPGIVSVKLPSDRPPLEVGQVYKWSFTIKCNAQGGDGNPSVVGWVKRTEPNPTLIKALDKATPLERAALYGENSLWQDLLTTLVELRHSQPENPALKAIWENLLVSESVKLSREVALAPLVNR